MKEREILRRRGLMKSHIQTHALCLMSLSLFVPLFYFLSTDQLMEQFASVFLSTTPNFVFSRAHYSAFFLFLFVPSHFKFPLFHWWHLHFSTFRAHFPCFLVVPFPISHFTFLFYLFCFYLFLFIGSRQQTTHVAFIFIFFLVSACQLFVDDHAWPLHLSYRLVHSCHVSTGTYDTFYKVFFLFQQFRP